jgi:23S rRNA U2552 (ribose-2'-O)-methylase RlmE/FtsJ
MIEMITTFHLLSLNPTPISTFHLAEGPGGFIEAVCHRRTNPFDTYYGMTILEDETDDNVPAWKKSEHFLQSNPNVRIEVGADGTGNLLHLTNFDHCCERYGSSMDFITADGGFDFSKDFNKQEVSIAPLLWGQMCYAMAIQKYGGNFVLKIFDSFYAHTIDIMFVLSAFYTETYVAKLQTSRIGNSEKYLVCKGFRFHNNIPFLPYIRKSFQDVIASKFPVRRFLSIPIPRLFSLKVEDFNSMFGQQQIENIYYTISIIDKNLKTDKCEAIIRQNIIKCIHWCVEHGIPYNNLVSNNVFL